MQFFNKSFGNIVFDAIKKEINKYKFLDVYIVTAANEDDYSVNIKHPNFKKYEFDRVKIMGMGLGNFKGVMKLPSRDDYVVVGFFGGKSNTPVVLGTLFAQSNINAQAIPTVKDNQLLLINKEKGSYINLDEDNNIILRNVDNSGNKLNKIKLSNDGSFEVMNKDGYGIECDEDGNITMRGTTVNFTQTPKNG